MKYEYVRTLRLAGYLMMHGFRIVKIQKNKDYPNKDVYVFEQTESFTKCMLEYIEQSTKEKNYDSKRNCKGKNRKQKP